MTKENSPKKVVLVVDDEPDFADSLAAMLRQEGFSAAVAGDGEEALSSVRGRRPDLITLDIKMPRKTGLLFYRQLKSQAAYRDIPVIVITGLTRGDRDMETIIHSFMESERLPAPEAYLEKPVERESLVKAIGEVFHEPRA